MKYAIVGSRSFTDYEFLCEKLKTHNPHISMIVSGGAKGADSLASRYAYEHDIPLKEHIPEWDKYGRAAGMIRNKKIVEGSDVVIAFWDGESRGTKNSIDIAKKLNKKFVIINTSRNISHLCNG